MAQPLPPNTGGWRERPSNNSDQFTQAAPVAAAGWASHPGVATSGPAGAPPYQQPSQPHPTAAPPPPPKPRKSRKALIIGAAAAAVLLVVIAATAFFLSRPDGNGSSPQNATGQQAMPFNGLNFRFAPGGVAVDGSGTLYVTNQTMYGRVVALPDGSTSPTVKPFNGLYEPQGIAVDGAGKIYVSDFNNRVVALAAGSNNQVVLPFNGLNYPEGVAVDPQGNVYVADRGNNRVVKLAAGTQGADRAAVRRSEEPRRGGRGYPGQHLRHRHRQQPGADAGCRDQQSDGPAVHRHQRAVGHHRRRRGQRLRHRARQQRGGEAARRARPRRWNCRSKA